MQSPVRFQSYDSTRLRSVLLVGSAFPASANANADWVQRDYYQVPHQVAIVGADVFFGNVPSVDGHVEWSVNVGRVLTKNLEGGLSDNTLGGLGIGVQSSTGALQKIPQNKDWQETGSTIGTEQLNEVWFRSAFDEHSIGAPNNLYGPSKAIMQRLIMLPHPYAYIADAGDHIHIGALGHWVNGAANWGGSDLRAIIHLFYLDRTGFQAVFNKTPAPNP